MHHVYAICNRKHDRIYVGETADLRERLKAHNDRRFPTSYTARFDGLWKLIYTEKCVDRQAARTREKQLKSFRGREFVRQCIS